MFESNQVTQRSFSGCPLIELELDQAESELRDESPSPSLNHHPPSTSPSIFPSKQQWNSLQKGLRFAGLMLGIGGEKQAINGGGVVGFLAVDPDG
jgi:hypothetical protein